MDQDCSSLASTSAFYDSSVNKFHPPKLSHTAGYIMMLVKPDAAFLCMHERRQNRKGSTKVSTKHEPALISNMQTRK